MANDQIQMSGERPTLSDDDITCLKMTGYTLAEWNEKTKDLVSGPGRPVVLRRGCKKYVMNVDAINKNRKRRRPTCTHCGQPIPLSGRAAKEASARLAELANRHRLSG
jgi:hypothetical protein